MGRRMAAHCVAKQELSVWNRSPKAAADFAATHGATQTDLPAELAAASDMVITMLADDQAARDVFLGTGGLIAADGADLLVEMGTMSPGLIREIAESVDQADNSHAGVDDEVAVATCHVPDVASHERYHVGLPQQGDLVVDWLCLEPAVCDWKCHLST